MRLSQIDYAACLFQMSRVAVGLVACVQCCTNTWLSVQKTTETINID